MEILNGVKVPVYNQSGQEQSRLELNPRIFAIPEIKPEVVHQVVQATLSNMRRPLASTKTKGEVRGGGKKPWKQKGTGRARAGSIRSPLWRGGGVIFGPRPNRNFSKKLNKKIRCLGLFTVLTDKAKDQKLLVLENFDLKDGKTKEFLVKLRELTAKFPNLTDRLLIIVPDKAEKLERAVKNLPKVRINRANNLNILDLLYADCVIVIKEALPIVEKTYL